MSGGGYEVDHEKLAGAGKDVAGHAPKLERIKAEVREAEVDTKSWGLLGIELPLYSKYVQLLTELEQHLHMSQQHIQSLGEGLTDTAKMYAKLEDDLANVFKGIKSDTEKWARDHPGEAGKIAGTAGPEVTV